MKTSLLMPLGLGLALVTAVPLALAQAAPEPGGAPHRGGGQRGFEAMDADHDGFVTLDEWKAAGRNEKRFAAIDADHDGKLTREELRAFMEKMRAQRQANGGGWGGEHSDGH